ncbi:MAG: cysteine--tRNA ligase [Anaerolineae bacterium]|nr:cysteine--tRNA ligase [Anaerolineae bacterium]
MSIKIYNTLTRKKEELQTLEPGKVRMYVCGVTVYDRAHIGHAMSAMVFDIIRRYLQYRGYEVRYVMNFTDVDDKIIQRANQRGEDPFTLSERYIREYQQNLADLNILPATVNPRATNEMAQIITMINGLIDGGYAYSVDGDVYFRVKMDEDYGRLSGRQLDEMQAGARIEVDERKENPLDFALWKAAKPGEPAWEAPWGQGRPGWHIECSAMNLHHLGEQIDIHGGGNDLIFPHHENEIAQTESLTGKPFARYWVHNGLLNLSGEKMSKSTGVLITINDYLTQHSANAFRMLVLTSAYRNPLAFSNEIIEQAERGVERLQSALRPGMPGTDGISSEAERNLGKQADATRAAFIAAMDDDFNTAGALGSMFDLVRALNQARADGATSGDLEPAQATLLELAGVLGLRLQPEDDSGSQAADPFIGLLLDLRQDLRKQKLFDLADGIRQRLLDLDVLVEDTKEGSSWRWSKRA